MITKNKGITLLALIITIIVMLILAGVSMSMLFGEDGVIKQAQEAARKTEEKSIYENVVGLITYFDEGVKDLDTTYENISKHYGLDLTGYTKGKRLLIVKIKGKHGEYEYQIDGISILNNGDAYAILVDDGSSNSTYTMYFIKSEEILKDTKIYYYDEKWNEIIEDTEENKPKIEKAKAKKVEYLYSNVESKQQWSRTKRVDEEDIIDVDNCMKNVISVDFKDDIIINNFVNYFYGFEKCKNINFRKIHFQNEYKMTGMFAQCKELTNIELDFDSIENISGEITNMFHSCENLRSVKLGNDLGKYNIEGMKRMFYKCTNLKNVIFKGSWNISGDIGHMFENCGALEGIIFGKEWNTENVTVMRYMFCKCENLKIDCSDWNVTNVTEYNRLYFKMGISEENKNNIKEPNWKTE